MNIDVLSFSRLSYRIMEEVGNEQGVMLDDTGKNLVLRRVAGEKKDELKVIGANLKKIGYTHEVKSMISEFYQYDIGENELNDMIKYAEKKGALSYKLKDLQLLRQAFAEYIKDKYITTEELLERLCGILPQSQIVRDSVIVLDGFTGFTPIQNKLIRELMRLSKEFIVTLVADGEDDIKKDTGEYAKEKLFYLSKHTYQVLEKIAREENIELLDDIYLTREKENDNNVIRYRNNNELGFLERNLFREKPVSYAEKVENICMIEAGNPKKEVQAMLLEICSLVQKEGYAYRDIAVVAGDMAVYEHLMKTEFAHYNVPLYMDQTKGILFHPMSEFLRAALEVILYDFSKESVIRFLRTSLTDLSKEEIDRFELYITSFGIRSAKRYERIFTKKPQKEEELEKINETREQIFTLFQPMLKVCEKKEFEAVKMIEALYELCLLTRLQEKMEKKRVYFEDKGDLAKAREYAQVYKAVIDLFDQMHALLLGEKMEMSEFAQIMEAGLSEITIGTIPQNVDQVVAGDIERTRLKQVKALFFIGVNDGAIPKGSKGGGLLSDMEREFLTGAGHELAPTPRQQIFMQRLYLYLNMTKPSEKLYISYSRVDNEGKGIRKSYLINAIKKMFPKLLIIKPEEGSVLSKIATESDGLDDLAELFGAYARGEFEQDKEKKEEFLALLSAYRKNGGEGLVSMFMDSAFYTYQPVKLSEEIARALYGDIIESSVGRLEMFSSCAYAHFLKYGMSLAKQKEYEVDSADIGNIYHEMMKRFSEFLKENGYTWADFPKEEAEKFVDETMDKLSKEYENALFYSTASDLYVMKDMSAVLKRTILTLRYQMAKGMFEPRSFEVPFYMGDKIKTKGRIDRIDTFTKDGNVYVKVVDYKSGKHQFDPVEFYFGLKMQLAVYMKAAVDMTEKENPKENVVPAALVYYQFQNPFVELEGNEAMGADGSFMMSVLEDKVHEKMKLTGLVCEDEEVILAMDKEFETQSDIMSVKRKKDGSFYQNSITGTRKQMELLMDYADYKIKEVGERVYQGEITANPYEMKGETACKYCSFHSVCHFDTAVDGYAVRRLDAIKEDEAWEKMEDACKGE